MESSEIVDRLCGFVYHMCRAGVDCHDDYAEWSAEREDVIADCFAYHRTDDMPSILHLVNPHFHPRKPLVGLNYTPLAHNTLFRYPEGWTWPLRYCRGIVFEDTGVLIALPFYKFFNYLEHPETHNLPLDGPCLATEKHDGHLGIIYNYRRHWDLATRGSFMSRSAQIGRRMLADYRNRFWHQAAYHTLLAEIVHQDTHVIRDYGDQQQLILLAMFDNIKHEELPYDEVVAWGKKLGLPVTRAWPVCDTASIKAMVDDPSITNREGCVARYPNGLRVKFKFRDYIRIMKERKLSYTRLMDRLTAGTLDSYFNSLPEEVLAEAREMLELINRARLMDDVESRTVYLSSLMTPSELEKRGRALCGRTARFFTSA